MRETIDYDPIEELVAEGRRALKEGELEHAKWCFEEVLSRRADHPRALLGLKYVTRQSGAPSSPPDVMDADLHIVELVKDKRYEEAIEVIERELLTRPSDPILTKSLAHLRGHIRKRYLQQLGGRDSVHQLADPQGLAPELVALFDGERTLGEVLDARGDEDETLRLLVALADELRLLRVDDYGPSNEPPSLPPPSSAGQVAAPAGPKVPQVPRVPEGMALEIDTEAMVAEPAADRGAVAREPTDRSAPLGAPSPDVTGRLQAMQDGKSSGPGLVPALTLLLLAAIVIATLVLTRG